jgi:hypothetical protein
VPVGKRILVRDNLGWGNDIHIGFDDWNDWNWRYGDEGYGWDHDVEYVMTTDGLKRVHPLKEDNDENENNDNNDNNNNPADTLKNNKDSSQYHYQPSKKEEAKKTEVKIPVHAQDNSGVVNIHDLALTIIGRATI